ncbi:NHL repeat-containing protein [Sphingobacterium chuzhouense]|uniref:ATP-binding protein n=1 Tax=Sphingobacterium chuzhouense TaxID=1742264 RepID=A0ABR7XP17_9SPHI|nr:ATP-binding protein [Sphingobacterium chuzhouense]MBD1420914.1 ATP-binding protein [Sphingobacterium chuzhouense]
MKRLLLFSLGAALSTTAFGQHQLTELWETKNLPVPESVLYHAGNNVLYVSLIDGDGATKDGQGGVAVLNLDGSVKDQNWVTGLNAPKGMASYKDFLYVADITAVSVVDLVTGNVVNEIEFPGAVFLNDVTVDNAGVVYVSDTRTGTIYQMRNNKPTVFLENAPNVNGLKFIKGSLYALVGPELWKVDANKKSTVIAKGFELGGDGLEPVGNDGDFLVTCWGGLVYYVKADGSFEKLMDVQGKMNTADLGIHPETNTIYIPTFNSNSVKAFKLDKK